MMHPAKSALVALGKKFPEMAKTVDYAAFGEGARSAGEWPEEYLLPKQVWRGLLNYLSSTMDYGGPIPNFDELRFLGTWAKTQGIYRFDKDIMEELLGSPPEGDIPAELLRRLPEWCLYIELPNLVLFSGIQCRGAWVMNEFSQDGVVAYKPGAKPVSQHALSIMFDPWLPSGLRSPQPITMSVPLGSWTLDSVFEKYHAGVMEHVDDPLIAKMGLRREPSEMREMLGGVTKLVPKIISLALYIATQNDISNKSGARPVRPVPQKTKKGVRMYDPSTPQIWDVGVRMGSELRQAKQVIEAAKAAGSIGGAVRPHIRKPHWHSYRTGPMKTEQGESIPAAMRDLVVHFIPSLQVNFAPGMTRDDLPAVIRRVRGEREDAADGERDPLVPLTKLSEDAGLYDDDFSPS